MIKTGTDTDRYLIQEDIMKKRAISLCLAGLMAVSLAGCGGAGIQRRKKNLYSLITAISAI